jgi:cysteine-rich repeat protein
MAGQGRDPRILPLLEYATSPASFIMLSGGAAMKRLVSLARGALLKLGVLGALIGAGIAFIAAVEGGGADPQVTTDNPDYSSWETVTITGSYFAANSYYDVPVMRPDGSYIKGDGSFQAGWDTVLTDGSGGFTYHYKLDGIQGVYWVAVYDWPWAKPGSSQIPLATTSFRDADIHFTQCRNKWPGPDCEWTTGAINTSNSTYLEGDSVPQRLFHKVDDAGGHTMLLQYEFTKSDVYAYDFLSNVDQTLGANLDPCDDLPGFVSTGICNNLYSATALVPIPSDPFDLVSTRENPAGSGARNFRVACTPACSAVSVTFPSPSHDPDPDPDCFRDCGDSDVSIELNFTTEVSNTLVGVWFGGHLAQEADPDGGGPLEGWGTGCNGSGCGSSSIGGAPFHIKYVSLDGKSIGGRDNAIQTGPALCGNGVIDPGEQCDDGNTAGGDSCSSTCQLEVCGNGIMDPGEQCDDGNLVNGDGCSSTCENEVCGNNIVDPGEQCDDGNLVDGDGCSSTCQLEVCGNGVVGPGEQCDDGNLDNGDGCSSTCQLEVCGNNVVDPGEQCDDGNVVNGDGCSSNCQLEVCGNDVLDPGEQCDDGNLDNGDGCSSTCRFEVCGNNVVDLGEQCDGTDDAACAGACQVDCTCPLPACGDGNVDPGEQCDDGNTTGGDGCSSTCKVEACGNGIMDPGEQCDDGNTTGGDGCSSTCKVEACGNGIMDPGEQCDDGNTTGGDGCSSTCKVEACGNGIMDPGEQCDDGNTTGGDGCSSTCKVEACGNAIMDPGEQCDDGNLVDGDGCSSTCQNEVCGNGVLELGEQCDDGNVVNGDGCSSTCQLEVCGNNVLDPGEQCDDGNLVNGDGCSSTCKLEGAPPPGVGGIVEMQVDGSDSPASFADSSGTGGLPYAALAGAAAAGALAVVAGTWYARRRWLG